MAKLPVFHPEKSANVKFIACFFPLKISKPLPLPKIENSGILPAYFIAFLLKKDTLILCHLWLTKVRLNKSLVR